MNLLEDQQEACPKHHCSPHLRPSPIRLFATTQDRQTLLKWAEIDGPFWPDAQAVAIMKQEPDARVASIQAVFVFQKIGQHTCEVHLKTNGERAFLTRRTASLIAAYAFDFLGMNRIEALVAPNNDDCQKIILRAGFRFEARIKDGHGPKQDAIQYAILREDCRWLSDLQKGVTNG